MPTVSEKELIARFQAGDTEAFGLIFETHHRRIANLAYQVVRDEDAALDAAQEVFLRAHQELARWRGEAQLSTWLYRTALNVCFEQLRADEKHRRSRESHRRLTDEMSPEEQFSRAELREIIGKAVQKLPPQQQSIFILKQYQQLRFSEIARILEISEGGAKASYHKAIVALRERLKVVAPEPYNQVVDVKSSFDGA